MNENGEPLVGRFAVNVEVSHYGDMLQHREGKLPADKIRRIALSGIVDSGAAKLFLPEGVAQQLGFPVKGKIRVKYGDAQSVLRDEVEGVYVQLQGRGDVFSAVVEPARSDALIGAIVLEDLDFLVDCKKQRLIPRDPEYVSADN
ncbi:MAG: hypothetical protein L0Y72_18800 [Gemmataceae bacterium]|nr:hypothetical protein [Gemmataceae bacterium]MCI0741098.1 hypothetical protein [Gemmataceae bacterium]